MSSIKKRIGRFGRRYGGRPFEAVVRFVHNAYGMANDMIETVRICGKHFVAGPEDAGFYDRYYTAKPAFGIVDASSERVELTRGIICMYDGRIVHGGLTDRIRGLLTTYREAKRRGVSFYIYWDTPFELADYLEPAEVDWRIDRRELSFYKEEAYPVIIQDMSNLNNKLRLDAALFRARPQTHVYSNADNARGEYAGLYNELFKPTAALQSLVDSHLAELGTGYEAFAFRFMSLLGDFDDCSGEILREKEYDDFIERVIGEFRKRIESLPDDRRILVTSDSRKFLDMALAMDSRIYVAPGLVKHIDRDRGNHEDAWMKTFVDQQLLMHAEKVTQMITGKMYNSGFPRFAAEVGGTQYVLHRF